MGSIVQRSDPTNLKWFPNCSHAQALFRDRFKDVQVGFKVVQYTVHPLTKLSHPFLDSSAVHRSTYGLPYRLQGN